MQLFVNNVISMNLSRKLFINLLFFLPWRFYRNRLWLWETWSPWACVEDWRAHCQWLHSAASGSLEGTGGSLISGHQMDPCVLPVVPFFMLLTDCRFSVGRCWNITDQMIRYHRILCPLVWQKKWMSFLFLKTSLTWSWVMPIYSPL